MADEPFSGFQAQLNETEAALAAFASGPAQRAANEVADAFDRAGARIARSLGRAGASGELSFKRLAKTILEEFAKIALDKVLGGKSASFFGARAAGGAVNAGGAYLVGERGPEWFTPNGAGTISQANTAPIAIHFHLGAGADSQSIARHQGQIAAAVARAVAYGRRNL